MRKNLAVLHMYQYCVPCELYSLSYTRTVLPTRWHLASMAATGPFELSTTAFLSYFVETRSKMHL